MIRNKCQMRQDAGWHVRWKTQMTHVHVGHVVFGDQLIFGQPFVKRFALPIGLLSVCLSCLFGVSWPNGRASSRIMYCGHSTQYSYLVVLLVLTCVMLILCAPINLYLVGLMSISNLL